MTKRVGGALLVAALAVVLPAAVMAGPDGAASVAFGDPDVGSPGPVGPPPIEIHDSSINAQFNLVPRTVVVSAPGTVTFTVSGPQDRRLTPVPHQVAVCKAASGPTMSSSRTRPRCSSTIRTVRPTGHRPMRVRPSQCSSRSLGGTWSSATSGRTSPSSTCTAGLLSSSRAMTPGTGRDRGGRFPTQVVTSGIDLIVSYPAPRAAPSVAHASPVPEYLARYQGGSFVAHLRKGGTWRHTPAAGGACGGLAVHCSERLAPPRVSRATLCFGVALGRSSKPGPGLVAG